MLGPNKEKMNLNAVKEHDLAVFQHLFPIYVSCTIEEITALTYDRG